MNFAPFSKKRFKQTQMKLSKQPNNRMVLSLSWYWFYALCNKLKYKLVFVVGSHFLIFFWLCHDLIYVDMLDIVACTSLHPRLNGIGNIFLGILFKNAMWKIVTINAGKSLCGKSLCERVWYIYLHNVIYRSMMWKLYENGVEALVLYIWFYFM